MVALGAGQEGLGRVVGATVPARPGGGRCRAAGLLEFVTPVAQHLG